MDDRPSSRAARGNPAAVVAEASGTQTGVPIGTAMSQPLCQTVRPLPNGSIRWPGPEVRTPPSTGDWRAARATVDKASMQMMQRVCKDFIADDLFFTKGDAVYNL